MALIRVRRTPPSRLSIEYGLSPVAVAAGLVLVGGGTFAGLRAAEVWMTLAAAALIAVGVFVALVGAGVEVYTIDRGSRQVTVRERYVFGRRRAQIALDAIVAARVAVDVPPGHASSKPQLFSVRLDLADGRHMLLNGPWYRTRRRAVAEQIASLIRDFLGLPELPHDTAQPLALMLPAGGEPASAVAFAPDGRFLASASWDGAVRLWRVSDGAQLRVIAAGNGPQWSVIFTPDGHALAAGSRRGSVRLWRVSDGAQLAAIEGHAGGARALAFAPDGQTLAVACDMERTAAGDHAVVRLWAAREAVHLRSLNGHRGSVEGLAFAPDGHALVSVSTDGLVRVRTPSGAPLNTLALAAPALCVAFTPDSRVFAVGAADGIIRLYRAGDETPTITLDTQGGAVRGLAFACGGRLLASASDDGNVRIWRPADGGPPRLLFGHAASVSCVAFAPDGGLLASASDDGSIRVWKIEAV